MTTAGAEQAVSASALVVGGVYLYRKFTEGAVPPVASAASKAGGKPASLLGFGPVPSVGRFVTGWGFTFMVLSLLAEAMPDFGGWLAILVATGDVLANGTAISVDVNHKLSTPGAK